MNADFARILAALLDPLAFVTILGSAGLLFVLVRLIFSDEDPKP